MKINPILRRNTYMLSWETFFFVGEMRNELNKIKVNADLTLFSGIRKFYKMGQNVRQNVYNSGRLSTYTTYYTSFNFVFVCVRSMSGKIN